MLQKNIPIFSLSSRTARPRAAKNFLELNLSELDALAERFGGEAVPGVQLSEPEFADWCPEGLRAEWVDGKVILMSPSNVEHDELSIWLIRLLGDYVDEHNLGSIYQNIFVRFAGQHRRRVPDLLFVAADRRDLLKPTYLDGPPDLLIEIVSPDSQSRDRREKYLEYEKAGVREYWIVDPLSKTVEVFRLEKKKFQRIEETAGVIASIVLKGFRIKTAQLWQKPLPKVSGVLKWMTKR